MIEHRDYSYNEKCRWEVHANCSLVHLTSTHLDIEMCCDLVKIDNQLDKLWDQHYGYSIIDTFVSGNFTVSFSSDLTVTQTGFTLQWKCAQIVDNYYF